MWSLISYAPLVQPSLFCGFFYRSPFRRLLHSGDSYYGIWIYPNRISLYIFSLFSEKKGGKPTNISKSKAPKW